MDGPVRRSQHHFKSPINHYLGNPILPICLMDKNAYAMVRETIINRKTTKVFSENPSETQLEEHELESLLQIAGNAPFHRPCHPAYLVEQPQPDVDAVDVPWRAYALTGSACRRLRQQIDSPHAGKIPSMLNAALGLVLVHWLPDPPTEQSPQTFSVEVGHADNSKPVDGVDFEPTLRNMEHIAAASSLIQNLLLVATSSNFANYWSSGGILRNEFTRTWIGATPREILLGAVFLFPGDNIQAGQTSVGSKLRERRPDTGRWLHVIP